MSIIDLHFKFLTFTFCTTEFKAFSGDDYLVRNDNKISDRYISPKNQKQGM